MGGTPSIEGIGLEPVGVETTDGARVMIPDRLETTAPHVRAVGDYAGSPHFTHLTY
jgi:pyruvate/2-oxoglutarate dehydrogenase complex dihydrolipoamide dehydrogenase (E3) component